MAVLGLGGSDCEALRDGWLGQPINSLSSLAFVVAGAAVGRKGGPAWPAAALVMVGLGSLLYHGPMPSMAALAHDVSLIALLVALVHVVWRRLAGPPPALAIVAAVAGIAINFLSRTGAPLCRPASLLQGHAAWHLLTAFACALWLRRLPTPVEFEPHSRSHWPWNAQPRMSPGLRVREHERKPA